MFNLNPALAFKVIATIDPAAITGAEVFTDPIDMTIWESVLAVMATGDIDGGSIDFKVYQCDVAGDNATAAIKAAAHLATDATVNDIGQIIMAFRASEMIAAGALTFCKFGLTIGANGGPACVLVLGIEPRKFNDVAALATVVEVKS